MLIATPCIYPLPAQFSSVAWPRQRGAVACDGRPPGQGHLGGPKSSSFNRGRPGLLENQQRRVRGEIIRAKDRMRIVKEANKRKRRASKNVLLPTFRTKYAEQYNSFPVTYRSRPLASRIFRLPWAFLPSPTEKRPGRDGQCQPFRIHFAAAAGPLIATHPAIAQREY